MKKRYLYLIGLSLLILGGCQGPPSAGQDSNAPGSPPPTPGSSTGPETSSTQDPNTGVETQPSDTAPESPADAGFILTSPVMVDGGNLPLTYTCGGDSLSPPLEWHNAPEGTVGYALDMHHIPGPGDTHWYWVVYNIPAETTSVDAGATGFGTFGINSVNSRPEYAPPCSQGPGAKLYTISVHALSAVPNLPDPTTVDRDTMLAAIADITLASADMDVNFDRTAGENSEPIGGDDGTIAASGCPTGLELIFAAYDDRAHVRCDGSFMYVETETGQPEHEMMVDITSWILRVPIPFSYEGTTAWTFPLEPQWLDEHQATHARGPLAMAVNGVPIYHFDKRPDVELGKDYVYDPMFDTVEQGELDHCGGHAGQGEDYHYHLAPVCLLDDHDLELPIAFTLGGVQIFYGTGADDFYGYGQHSEINNLPDGELDECNAYHLPDGSVIYYTTNEPPYVVGCHHEAVDWAGQIEPRVMRPLGEFGRNAIRIISFTVEGDIRTLIFETNQGDLNAVVYYPAPGDNCWDFEFRLDVDVSSTSETYCRVE